MLFKRVTAFRSFLGSAAGRRKAAFLVLPLLLSTTGIPSGDVAAAERMTVREIAEVFGRSMVTTGQTLGIGVAIIVGNERPRFFTYGNDVPGVGLALPKPFSPDLLFEIGSNTKVFTTNLLGQRVYTGELTLDRPLSSFPVHLGALKPRTRQITLKQLGDFTAGIADEPPPCSARRIPGCLPSGRPTIKEYTAQDFVDYFQFIVPRNWTVTPPPVASLPAPYNYSNFSVGLLGLLLAAPPREPIRNATVHRWFETIRAAILRPLGMRETFLRIPPRAVHRKAAGYHLAIARAEVARGAIADILVENGGSFYTRPPRVTITGGGGSGAAAVATLDGDRVNAITVTQGGSGYIPPAQVLFNFGGSTAIAKADVIVSDGRVVGIAIRDGGAGYQRVPQVTISGGRRGPGRDATATAHLVNGQVGFLTVDDPGAGYVEPVSVLVAPGGTSNNNIPVWAAAGALSSTLRDMAKFAQAALGQVKDSVPERIVKGFEIAQQPYACQGSKDPSLANCPPGAFRSGLAWQVQPADPANGVPTIVAKGGGLPGYWSYISLMPERGLGVVVFMNTFPGRALSSVPEDVRFVAGNILYALFHRSLQQR